VQWKAAKRSNKMKVISFLKEKTGYSVSPDAMFDIQVTSLMLNFSHSHSCDVVESSHLLTNRSKMKFQINIEGYFYFCNEFIYFYYVELTS
jgi:hypothetical protein